MAISYYPQYSLLVTATNAGLFPVQVTSLPALAAGTVISVSGLTSASVSISNPTIEQVTGATHNNLSIAVAGKSVAGSVTPLQTDEAGRLWLSSSTDIHISSFPSFPLINVLAKSSLVSTTHDYIFLSYTSLGLTRVEFKSGGSGGTTVSILTLGYSSTSLTSVTKT